MMRNFPFTYESKDPEQRLHQLEVFMSSLLDGIGEGVIIVNRDFTIRSANAGFCRQVGMTCADILGYKCHAISHHSDVPCHQLGNGCDCSVQKCFDTGQHHRALHKHYDKDGNPLFIETNSYPLADDTGAVTSAVETLHDVTANVLLQDQLREVQARYRKLYDEAPDMMHSIDGTGRIALCNAVEAETLGYRREELIGKPFMDIIAPESRHLCDAKLAALKASGSFEGELTLLARDGRYIPVFVKSRAIFGDNGDFLMSDTVLRDISDRKTLESQLLQAQKMEAVGLLAGGIAHDFNNILTAIIGYGNIFQMKMAVDDPNRHYIEQILASADRAANLTQGLLAFSRKQILSPKAVNLSDIVSRLQKFLVRIIGEDIELTVSPPEREAAVMADVGQIEQVLMNLATNARDAMPDGGSLMIEMERVELDRDYVRRHSFAKEGQYMLLTLTDTGGGMNEATRVKIFEPFFTTKDVGRGTGLGLSIVYGIIKQHNGYINVYSEPGKGTTFRIYLPAVPFEADHLTPAVLAPVTGGTETVLLAEDEIAVRELTRNILEEYGYKVIPAENGEEALKKFTSLAKDIDILVLDVMMPLKSGKDVLEAANKLKPGVKALFMTGYTTNMIHSRGVLDSGIELISKPFSPNAFLRKIRKILDKQ